MRSDDSSGIDRRRFIKTSGVGLAGLTLLPSLSGAALAQHHDTSHRRVYPLNHKWLYSEKNPANGARLQFNDATFTKVTIPHTNKLLPWHGFDDKEYQFVSLYRRHFSMPSGLTGRRVFIDFGGVMTAATVTINGQKLGEYRELHVEPDDLELLGDGIDASRVVLKVTDEFGSVRPLANAAIAISINGPGEIIGENPFSLFGGVGAVWVKTKEAAGVIRLSAKHPTLGSKTVMIRVKEFLAARAP